MRKPWFDEYGNVLKRIPKQCVQDCSHSGACDQDVEYWQTKLGFAVPREKAIAYLREFGAWEFAELCEKTDENLAQIVLWIACGDIEEQGEWFGLVH